MAQTDDVELPLQLGVGDELPSIELEVTYTRVATLVAGTWDVFPGHHDPHYAIDQGQRDIYLNTMVLAGFLDRAVMDWAGPESFIRKRSMRIARSVFPGDRLQSQATIRELNCEGVSIDVRVDVVCSTASGPCIEGTVDVRIPLEKHPT